MPAPAIAEADTEWLVRSRLPAKPGGGDQKCLGSAEARLGSFRVGDAGNRERRIFGGGGACHQRLGRRLACVFQVQRDGFRRRGGVGQAGVGVLRHHAGHRDRAFGQFLEAGWRHSAGGDDGGPLAEEHPQTKVLPFRTLDVLGLAEPALHRQRGAGNEHRVGRIRPRGTCAGDQVGEEVKWLGSHCHAACGM